MKRAKCILPFFPCLPTSTSHKHILPHPLLPHRTPTPSPLDINTSEAPFLSELLSPLPLPFHLSSLIFYRSTPLLPQDNQPHQHHRVVINHRRDKHHHYNSSPQPTNSSPKALPKTNQRSTHRKSSPLEK